MTVNGINGVNAQMGQMGMNQATDPYSRQIQNQIANLQKELQELSSNKDMALEEKMKKRQEIQQQISDLNMQLRQHQMEQRREKQQEKSSSSSDNIFDPDGQSNNNSKVKENQKASGLSQASMEAMISADTSIKQAKTQGSVATKMEGRAGVLKAEIKLDGARGGDTYSKTQELAKTEKKAGEATASQLSALADANRTMEGAAKADNKAEKEDDKDIYTKERDTEEKASGIDSQKETVSSAENVNSQSDGTIETSRLYTPVDVRL